MKEMNKSREESLGFTFTKKEYENNKMLQIFFNEVDLEWQDKVLNMPELKGSEAQIEWAEQIRLNVLGTLELAKESVPDHKDAEKVREIYQKRIDALMQAEYAGDIINLFKDAVVKYDRDPLSKEEDVKRKCNRILKVNAVYKVTPESDGEAKILLK